MTTESFWEATGRLRQYIDGDAVERPAMVPHVRALSPRRWPDCTVCGCDVLRCECDPDATLHIRLDAMRARLNGEGASL